jgi:vacuolar-type H+-ATPase subunit E/Vma4
MDKTALESSIREECARSIAAIKEKEALEIRRMEETYLAEIDSFRKQAAAETEARLQQELSRLENRATLERRKFQLQSMEQFIKRTADEAMEEIKNDPRYRQFFLDAVLNAVAEISGSVEVRIHPADLAWEKEILAALTTAYRNKNIVINEDPTIRWGGCLVFDEAGDRIFNQTLERIYFRKSLLIRQRVMKILTDHSLKV